MGVTGHILVLPFPHRQYGVKEEEEGRTGTGMNAKGRLEEMVLFLRDFRIDTGVRELDDNVL